MRRFARAGLVAAALLASDMGPGAAQNTEPQRGRIDSSVESDSLSGFFLGGFLWISPVVGGEALTQVGPGGGLGLVGTAHLGPELAVDLRGAWSGHRDDLVGDVDQSSYGWRPALHVTLSRRVAG